MCHKITVDGTNELVRVNALTRFVSILHLLTAAAEQRQSCVLNPIDYSYVRHNDRRNMRMQPTHVGSRAGAGG